MMLRCIGENAEIELGGKGICGWGGDRAAALADADKHAVSGVHMCPMFNSFAVFKEL
jgi:hypothetical protein